MTGTSNGVATATATIYGASVVTGISHGIAAGAATLLSGMVGASRGISRTSAILITTSTGGRSSGSSVLSSALLTGNTTLFADTQFPVDLAWGARGGPQFKTDVGIAKKGAEQRNILWEQALCSYTVAEEVLTETNKDLLVAFARARRGSLWAFRFRDFFDYQVPQAQGLFVAAKNPIGSTSPAGPWQLLKVYSDSARTYYRRIFRPCSGLVADNLGVLPPVPIIYNGSTPLIVNVDYTIDFTTGLVMMLGSTVPTSWTGWFDVPVRFTDDSARFLLTVFNSSDWPDIRVIEQRQVN